jgi:CarD family transcriptional regulator
MVAPNKSKKTTSSKTKKASAASRAKPRSKRTTKGASASARSGVNKSKAASNARAARKTSKASKTIRAKVKSAATKPSKRKQTSASVKTVNRAVATKKPTNAARPKVAASKSVNKTSRTAAVAKRATAARAQLNEQEAKLSTASRSVQEVRVVAEKGPAPVAALKSNSGHNVPAPPPADAVSASAKAVTPVVKVQKVEEAPKMAKAAGQRQGFKLNEFVVYPAHGVGQITAIEEQEVAGFKLELFVISFSKDKLTLRVPTSKVTGVGMRKISDSDTAKRSMEILTGRARVKRTMWSRRAQEYETKINSGDINAIAEVVRDLYRSEAQPEQSYSERQLYEAALDRMVREIAAVQKTNEIDALKAVEAQLQKGQSRAPKALSPPVAAGEIEQAA